MRNRLALWISALLHGGMAFALVTVAPQHGANRPAVEYQVLDLAMLPAPVPILPEPEVQPEPLPDIKPAPEPEEPKPAPEPEKIPEPEVKPEPEKIPTPEPVPAVKPEPVVKKVVQEKAPPKPKTKPKAKPKSESAKKPKKTETKPVSVAERNVMPSATVPVLTPAPARVAQQPSAPIAAPVAPAPARVAQQPSAPIAAPVAPAPVRANANNASQQLAAYYQSLGRALEKNRPRNARQRGAVTVLFTIQPDGRFSQIRLEQSSGNSALDEAALNTVRRTAQFQPTPTGQALQVRQKIRFQ